jgi:HAD superfamily hydrolase (TIGR01450 family)
LTSDLSRIRHIVLDMDGTIYLGENLFPTTLPFLSLLGRLGIGYTFITNNCSRSRAEYVARLRDVGIHVTPEDVSTSAQATVHFLRSHLPDVKRLFVLGTRGLCDDLRDGGYMIVDDHPDAVVVGFDSGLIYNRLARTAHWISQALPYIATHPDRVCPTNEPIVLPDCGAICALLESATGRRPDAVPGKPSPAMLRSIIDRHGLNADEIALVGDRLYTDIRMARDAGALAILTLTGETRRSDIDSAPDHERPELVVDDLDDLGTRLRVGRV